MNPLHLRTWSLLVSTISAATCVALGVGILALGTAGSYASAEDRGDAEAMKPIIDGWEVAQSDPDRLLSTLRGVVDLSDEQMQAEVKAWADPWINKIRRLSDGADAAIPIYSDLAYIGVEGGLPSAVTVRDLVIPPTLECWIPTGATVKIEEAIDAENFVQVTGQLSSWRVRKGGAAQVAPFQITSTFRLDHMPEGVADQQDSTDSPTDRLDGTAPGVMLSFVPPTGLTLTAQLPAEENGPKATPEWPSYRLWDHLPEMSQPQWLGLLAQLGTPNVPPTEDGGSPVGLGEASGASPTVPDAKAIGRVADETLAAMSTLAEDSAAAGQGARGPNPIIRWALLGACLLLGLGTASHLGLAHASRTYLDSDVPSNFPFPSPRLLALGALCALLLVMILRAYLQRSATLPAAGPWAAWIFILALAYGGGTLFSQRQLAWLR